MAIDDDHVCGGQRGQAQDPKVTIQSYLSAFLQAMTTLNSDQAFAQTELIRDIECILVSAVPLDGAPRTSWFASTAFSNSQFAILRLKSFSTTQPFTPLDPRKPES